MATVREDEASMQPGVKIAVAAFVLLVGLGLAMLFRHESPGFQPTAEPAREHLVLHQQGEPMIAPAMPWPPRSAATGVHVVRERPIAEPPTVLAPRRPDTSPPSLAREYPEASGSTAGWGTSRGMSSQMLLPRPAAGHKHTIIDGDNLPALAQRYLGSSDRYLEIYEANREALSGGPGVLPIGTVLVIPAR